MVLIGGSKFSLGLTGIDNNVTSSNSCFDLLRKYFVDTNDFSWVLATVVFKEGSSYRSPGAIMLVNSIGQTFGLVSGGCLESDIVRRSSQVFATGKAQYAEYDMLEEDSFAAELGIGCNGKIGILIQAITRDINNVLGLIFKRMKAGFPCRLLQIFRSDYSDDLNALSLFDTEGELLASSSPVVSVSSLPVGPWSDHMNFSRDGADYSFSLIKPPLKLCVFGGGVDAEPLVRMAAQLGWRVTVVDHRPAYARASVFESAEHIVKLRPDEMSLAEKTLSMDAAVLMTHNLKLDAQWLDYLYGLSPPAYVGLLGPCDRKHRVGALMQVDTQGWFEREVYGPAGLDIGGELPESIALSILSQCHQVMMSDHQG